MVVKYTDAIADRGARELLPLDRSVMDTKDDLSAFFWFEPRDDDDLIVCDDTNKQLAGIIEFSGPPRPFGPG